MSHTPERPSPKDLVPVLIPPVLAGILLFAGLGGAGFWEPDEIQALESALFADPGVEPAPFSPLTRILTRPAVSLLGGGESAARLPGALLCWLAVLVVHGTLLALGGRRRAAFGTLAFASSAACLLHGRQLTGDAPLLLAQTAATAGLALAAFGRGRGTAVTGTALAALGLLAGPPEAGLLAGAALPAATVLAALALAGGTGRGLPGRERVRRVAVLAVAGAVTLAALGAWLAVVLSGIPDVFLVTGGAAGTAFSWPGFDGPFDRLAYGWFPWAVLVPLALVPLLSGEGDAQPDPLPALAVAGIAVGCALHVADTSLRGPQPLFLALPMAAAVGCALERMERAPERGTLPAAYALVFAAVLVRDFAQTPAMALAAHGFENVALPADFEPALPAALAALPFGALVALLGFLPGRSTTEERPDRRRWLAPSLAVAAAAAVGGWIAFGLVPGLSRDLSPEHALEAFPALDSADEPLAILGDNAALPGAERLSSTGDLVRWLGRKDRVFALLPRSRLPAMDRAFRLKHGRHLHVLDGDDDRLLLVTNRPEAGERNANPLSGFVFLEPFDPPPRRTADADFGGRVSLLGWDLRSEAGSDVLERGRPFQLATYWRCDEPPGSDFRIFVHIEGPGARINADHAPVGGAFPTRDWRPGDHVLDVHEGKVVSRQAAGSYTVKVGLFRGDTRMEVIDAAPGAGNAAVLGTVEVK